MSLIFVKVDRHHTQSFEARELWRGWPFLSDFFALVCPLIPVLHQLWFLGQRKRSSTLFLDHFVKMCQLKKNSPVTEWNLPGKCCLVKEPIKKFSAWQAKVEESLQDGKTLRQFFLFKTTFILIFLLHLNCRVWSPPRGTKVVGLIYICHGFTEHMGNYNGVAEYLSAKGFYCFGTDLVGHGLR